MILKGKTFRALNSFEFEAVAEDMTWSVSDSGQIKQGIAKLWFEKTFLPNISNTRSQILTVEGHDSDKIVECPMK